MTTKSLARCGTYRLQRGPHGQAQAAEGQQADPLPAAEVNRAEQMTLASQLRQLIRVKPIQLVPLQLNFLDNRRDLCECSAASRGRTLYRLLLITYIAESLDLLL